MNTALSQLLDLDKINQEIQRLSDEVAGLPRKVAEIEAKLAGAQKQVEDATAAIKSSEANKRKLESDIQDWQQKIIKFREQSSSVKTNDQYRALMHEIEYAEQQIGSCEEKILIGMEASDGLNKQLAAAQAEFKEDQVEVEREKAHAKSVTAEDEARLKDLRVQADSLKQGLDASIVAHYQRVAAKRKNPIAEAFDQKCTACNVMMRPQRYQELLAGTELITCDSCGRILFVDPGHTSQEKPKTQRTEKAWYFVPEGDGGSSGRYLHLVNGKAGCHMRAYDAATGVQVEHSAHKKTTYQDAFAGLIASGQPLRGEALDVDEAAERLPAEALEELQLQAQIAPATS